MNIFDTADDTPAEALEVITDLMQATHVSDGEVFIGERFLREVLFQAESSARTYRLSGTDSVASVLKIIDDVVKFRSHVI